MNTLLYISPFGQKSDQNGQQIDFDHMRNQVSASLAQMTPPVTLFHLDEMIRPGAGMEVLGEIDKADVVICNISTNNPNCLYELGWAHARGKPCVVITTKSGQVPLDLSHFQIMRYDPDALSSDFLATLRANVSRALEDPCAFMVDQEETKAVQKVFISYSHRDKDYLQRLLIHLKPLESADLIDTWVDTQLKTGDRWKTEIENALESSSAAILLVSADFLASDFIVENELPPILAKAEVGGTRILPLILRPCRFARDPNLSQFQAHNSPEEPLSSLTPDEQERVFDRLAQELEGLSK